MRERPHSCVKCGWTFAESRNLKHHMLVSTFFALICRVKAQRKNEN